MAASTKQINFITNLVSQAQDLTQQANREDLAEQAIAPIKDIIVSAMTNPDNVSGPQARQAIDTLLALTRKLTGLAAAATLPRLANAERIIPNKFSKACSVCGHNVEAGEGHAALILGSWDTFCDPCAKGETREAKVEEAPAYTPERGDVHVVQVDGEDVYVRVSISQRTGRPYANAWTGHGYEYAPGLTSKLSAETVATAEQAAAFGAAYGQCCFCARQLDTPESITVGYGPTCAANRNLPWGTVAA